MVIRVQMHLVQQQPQELLLQQQLQRLHQELQLQQQQLQEVLMAQLHPDQDQIMLKKIGINFPIFLFELQILIKKYIINMMVIV